MAKQKVTITNNSIKSGVTTAVKKAICEFIWNGFDAGAVNVRINYSVNELGGISDLYIEDDGEGISRSSLNETFGKYQDSIKRHSFQWSSQIKGKKGKGRYSFNLFATKAKWISVCWENDHLIEHHISIDASDNDHFNDYSDDCVNKIVHNVRTGTKVEFFNVSLSESFFQSDDFVEYLKKSMQYF